MKNKFIFNSREKFHNKIIKCLSYKILDDMT